MSFECHGSVLIRDLHSEICKDSLRRQYGDKDKDWSNGLTNQESQAMPKILQKLKETVKEIRKEGWEGGRKGRKKMERDGEREERKKGRDGRNSD